MTAFFPQLRKYFLRFIRTYKVICKDTLHIIYTLLDNFFIVRAAILPQEEFQYIYRDVRSLFHLLGQILAHYFSVKMLPQLLLYDIMSAKAGLSIFKFAH